MSQSKVRMGASVFALLVCATTASAQTETNAGWNPAKFHATRAELQEQLSQYDAAAKSGAYTGTLREKAKFEAALIRSRLEQGDYQVGDMISLAVDGEPTLSDTLIVTSEITAILPFGDTLSLKGTLHSEVQERLRTAVAKVMKNPNVRTESFMRMAVLGAVGSQGYYVVRTDAMLMDVIKMAGGLGNGAELKGIRLERGSDKIWEGAALQEAIVQGRTVDQLSLRAGDRIVVPATGTTSVWGKIANMRRGSLLPITLVLSLLGVNIWRRAR